MSNEQSAMQEYLRDPSGPVPPELEWLCKSGKNLPDPIEERLRREAGDLERRDDDGGTM